MARKQGSHSDITGPKVREAALRLIARHGCAAVSMRQIAAEVGVQAGALYNYTTDKQTLLFDLMRHHMEQLLAAYADAPILAHHWNNWTRSRDFISTFICRAGTKSLCPTWNCVTSQMKI